MANYLIWVEVIWIKSLSSQPKAKPESVHSTRKRGGQRCMVLILMFVWGFADSNPHSFHLKTQIVLHFLFLIMWQKFRIEREKRVTTSISSHFQINRRDSWVPETKERISRNAHCELRDCRACLVTTHWAKTLASCTGAGPDENQDLHLFPHPPWIPTLPFWRQSSLWWDSLPLFLGTWHGILRPTLGDCSLAPFVLVVLGNCWWVYISV